MVKLFLVLNQETCHVEVWESGCIAPCILNHSTMWRQLINFMLCPLYPPGAQWTEGCMDPKASLDIERGKSCPAGN